MSRIEIPELANFMFNTELPALLPEGTPDTEVNKALRTLHEFQNKALRSFKKLTHGFLKAVLLHYDISFDEFASPENKSRAIAAVRMVVVAVLTENCPYLKDSQVAEIIFRERTSVTYYRNKYSVQKMYPDIKAKHTLLRSLWDNTNKMNID